MFEACISRSESNVSWINMTQICQSTRGVNAMLLFNVIVWRNYPLSILSASRNRLIHSCLQSSSLFLQMVYMRLTLSVVASEHSSVHLIIVLNHSMKQSPSVSKRLTAEAAETAGCRVSQMTAMTTTA